MLLELGWGAGGQLGELGCGGQQAAAWGHAWGSAWGPACRVAQQTGRGQHPGGCNFFAAPTCPGLGGGEGGQGRQLCTAGSLQCTAWLRTAAGGGYQAGAGAKSEKMGLACMKTAVAVAGLAAVAAPAPDLAVAAAAAAGLAAAAELGSASEAAALGSTAVAERERMAAAAEPGDMGAAAAGVLGGMRPAASAVSQKGTGLYVASEAQAAPNGARWGEVRGAGWACPCAQTGPASQPTCCEVLGPGPPREGQPGRAAAGQPPTCTTHANTIGTI